MFDTPGIGAEEVAWIERDQFVYYVEMEHALGDPADWPRFRWGLAAAVTAAFGIGPSPVSAGAASSRDHVGPADSCMLLAMLDGVRLRNDPNVDWDRFCEELWQGRRSFVAADE